MDPTADHVADSSRTSMRIYIITGLINFFERTAYFGISTLLLLFVNLDLGETNHDSAAISLIYEGTTYLLALFGGIFLHAVLSDSRIIPVGFILYFFGTLFIMFSAKHIHFNLHLKERHGLCFAGLCFVGIGHALATVRFLYLGAKQMQSENAQSVRGYFHWLYFTQNMAGVFVATLVVYVQQETDYVYALIFPPVAIFLALAVFLCGRKYYKPRTRTELSLLRQASKHVLQSCINWCRKVRVVTTELRNEASEDSPLLRTASVTRDCKSIVHTLGRITAVLGTGAFHFIGEVQTTFYYQGDRMNNNVTIGHLRSIASPAMAVFNTIPVLLLVPLFIYFIYPICDNYCPKLVSRKTRIGLGLIFAALSLAMAGTVEYYRLEDIALYNGTLVHVNGYDIYAANMSILWQIPQYCLQAIGEVFTIASIEYSYSEGPAALQGLTFGMYFATRGIGIYLGIIFRLLINKMTGPRQWYPQDINNGHVDNLFYVIAGLLGIDLIIYTFVICCYKSRNVLRIN